MNIVLIGFMGVGKSEVGRFLASELGLSYLDTDELIEKSEGRKIPEIFAKEGEEYFRDLEGDVAATLENYDDIVVSCGGGMALREENVNLLKEIGPLVLLTARPEVIFERTKTNKDRPLIEAPDKLLKIKEILAKRDPIYNAVADLKIDTSDKTVVEIAEEIIKYVQRKS